MNPLLRYPVANPPFRRASSLIMPGRSAPAGFYEPGSTPQALAWDDFNSPVGGSGIDLVNTRSTSGHQWFKHPSWSGVITGSNAGRARHNSGTIGLYLANCGYMTDCIVSGRLYFTAGWSSVANIQAGFVARCMVDADSAYYCFFNLASSTFVFSRRVAGSPTQLGSFATLSNWTTARSFMEKGGYVDLAMVCVGNTLKFYVDGVEKASVNDVNVEAGLPGLWAFTPVADATGIHIENFSARRISSPPVHAKGFTLTAPSNASAMTFGGVRAVRTNGATIEATQLLNLSGPGNAGPFRYQWYRSTIAGELPGRKTMLRGQTRALLHDTTAIQGTAYYYRCAITDAVGNTSFSDAHQITTMQATDKFAAFVGNSLTWGVGASGVTHGSNDYPTVTLSNLGAPWTGQNYGMPSWSDSDLALWMNYTMPYQYDPALAKCVAVYWEGTNSLNGLDNATTALANTAANCAYLKALGYQVAVCNVIDRQQAGVPADMATIISTYNTNLLSGYTAYADAHVDLHTLLSDSTNATNFQADKVHLTATGYGIVAGAVQTAVAAL